MSATSVEKVKQLLGKKIRIKMEDGRLIEGIFHCMDKDLNFILNASVEYHGVENGNIK